MKLTPAECAFEAFGGVRETARVLGISAGRVCRWQTRGAAAWLMPGAIPQHHLRTLLDEAARRGKTLTLDHLVFGREPVTQGVVTVINGRKVKVKLHDTWATMAQSLVSA